MLFLIRKCQRYEINPVQSIKIENSEPKWKISCLHGETTENLRNRSEQDMDRIAYRPCPEIGMFACLDFSK